MKRLYPLDHPLISRQRHALVLRTLVSIRVKPQPRPAYNAFFSLSVVRQLDNGIQSGVQIALENSNR